MKIGILTFHIARNYGAVLQCYCLTETLKRLQHEVKVIDYRPVYLVKAHSLFRKQWLKHPLSLLRFFILFPSALLRRGNSIISLHLFRCNPLLSRVPTMISMRSCSEATKSGTN